MSNQRSKKSSSKILIEKYFAETLVQKGWTGLQIPVIFKKQFITQTLSLPYGKGKEIGHFSLRISSGR